MIPGKNIQIFCKEFGEGMGRISGLRDIRQDIECSVWLNISLYQIFEIDTSSHSKEGEGGVFKANSYTVTRGTHGLILDPGNLNPDPQP